MKPAPIKGRFAPTPSGRMHLGNLFAALLGWLSVRSQGGRMLLRVEDLDLLRTSPAYTALILEDLLWLGLDWDEGYGCPRAGGDGPYLQSRRTAFYEAQLEQLAARGLVYPCFCSRAELHAASAPHLSDGATVYPGRCRHLSPLEVTEKKKTRGGALRLVVPDETICFTDGCQGKTCQNLAAECGDFILRRSDGVFAYQLAAPADDGAMGVTEVVRGRDLLSSAPRQIYLMRLLGYPPPRYFHVPLLLAPGGRRLSKRDKDLDVGAIRARNPDPQPLLGILGHLAGLVESPVPVTLPELLKAFTWEKVPREDICLPVDFLENLLE